VDKALTKQGSTAADSHRPSLWYLRALAAVRTWPPAQTAAGALREWGAWAPKGGHGAAGGKGKGVSVLMCMCKSVKERDNTNFWVKLGDRVRLRQFSTGCKRFLTTSPNREGAVSSTKFGVSEWE